VIIVGLVAAVLLLGALAAWAVSRGDVPGVPVPVTTQSAQALPAGPVRAEAVHELRFDQAARGYRMAQVDAALERLADELAARDDEIARLRGEHLADRSSDDTAATPPGGFSR
jgi:DivIVA domain-containing protein